MTTHKKTQHFFIALAIFFLNFFSSANAQNVNGFLHAEGTKIVNNKGNYFLKSVNTGNHLLQEGYMLNLGTAYQHIVKQKIAEVVGEANTEEFYKQYYANYITKEDVDSIAKWGFNSIRLPMHYNLFTPLNQPDVYLEEGFKLVDQLLKWCKDNDLYLILDLHAAPGGQSNHDISDYDKTKPSLWESEANRTQTIKLWKKFAERYANEEYIGGYDLINETNWKLEGNTLLMQLMKDITATIRTVDKNHILFVEGNNYANDFNGLTPKWDNNMAYSFHKYWNDVNTGSISWMLKIREEQNVPLWLGEFGENSNHWIAETAELMEQHNIGWAIWPYKKMDTHRGISSFKEPENWKVLAAFIKGEGAKPSAAEGQAILNEMLENIKAKNCSINYGYLYALFHKVNDVAQAHLPASIPGKIFAANYDDGNNGIAYADSAFQTAQYGSGGGKKVDWNSGKYFRNDGVDLRFSESEKNPVVAWTSNNEWMQYTVNVASAGTYTIQIRVSGKVGKFSLSCDGETIIDNATIVSSGEMENWQTIDLGKIKLSSGTHRLRFHITTGGYDLNYLDFSEAGLEASK